MANTVQLIRCEQVSVSIPVPLIERVRRLRETGRYSTNSEVYRKALIEFLDKQGVK